VTRGYGAVDSGLSDDVSGVGVGGRARDRGCFRGRYLGGQGWWRARTTCAGEPGADTTPRVPGAAIEPAAVAHLGGWCGLPYKMGAEMGGATSGPGVAGRRREAGRGVWGGQQGLGHRHGARGAVLKICVGAALRGGWARVGIAGPGRSGAGVGPGGMSGGGSTGAERRARGVRVAGVGGGWSRGGT
jgi:hypothetical protein